jgi:branched-subunit amino acid aminotransferase/4-amino-4-deoxychorismate lyase
MAAREAGPPTVFIFWRPVRIEPLPKLYAEGARLVIVPTRRVPPQCIETRAKITSKMNQILAELEADVNGALSLMLDVDGNMAENAIANFFIVRNGVLWTPPERNVLEGITRKVAIPIIPDTDSDLMPDACSEGWRTAWSERSDAGFQDIDRLIKPRQVSVFFSSILLSIEYGEHCE